MEDYFLTEIENKYITYKRMSLFLTWGVQKKELNLILNIYSPCLASGLMFLPIM